MARHTVRFEHPLTGEIQDASLGFSWKLLQFGALLPLYHRLWLLTGVVLVGGLLTFNVSNVLLAFFYDKLRVRALLARGFLVLYCPDGSLTQAEARLGLQLPRSANQGHNTD